MIKVVEKCLHLKRNTFYEQTDTKNFRSMLGLLSSVKSITVNMLHSRHMTVNNMGLCYYSNNSIISNWLLLSMSHKLIKYCQITHHFSPQGTLMPRHSQIRHGGGEHELQINSTISK